MRSDLEANRGRGLTLIATKLGTFKRKLTGDITLSPESTNNLLDPNGADRIVNLPAVATGVFMVISNTAAAGTNFNLVIKNNAGVTVVILSPQDSTWLVGNDNTFYAVAGLNSVFGPSGPNHKVGLVPDPGAVAGSTRVLKEDGTWGTFAAVANDSYAHITNGTITTVASGLDTFKIRSSTGKIGITVQENDVTHGDNADFTVVEAAVDHNSLLNYVANQHIDHSAVSITAGEGLSGGGTIAASRTLALAFAGLVAATPVLGDTLAFYSAGATAHRRMLVSELNSVLAHDSLAGFVGTKHIDHSLVFMIAGAGLSGGGDITATRTLSLDINSLTAQATMGANDYLAFYDVGGADHNKLTLTQLAASLTGIGFGGGGGGGTPGGANTQIQFNDAGAFGGDVDFTWDKTNNILGFGATGGQINANGAVVARFDASQRVTIGNASNVLVQGAPVRLEVVDDGTVNWNFANVIYGNHAFGAGYAFAKSRHATPGSQTILANNDDVGTLVWLGSNGVEHKSIAALRVYIDGAPGVGSLPTRMQFHTAPAGTTSSTERMRLDSAGNVNIGNQGASFATVFGDLTRLQLSGSGGVQGLDIRRYSADAASPYMSFTKSRSGTVGTNTAVQSGDAIGALWFTGYDATLTPVLQAGAFIEADADGAPTAGSIPGRLLFATAPSGGSPVERMRIDSAGRVVIGGAAAISSFQGTTTRLQVLGIDQQTASISVTRFGGGGSSKFFFGKTRGAAIGDYAVVQANDDIGTLQFLGADGTDMDVAGEIVVSVDGTPGLNDMPGRMVFKTTPDGAAAPVERMRVAANGTVAIGAGAATTNGGSPVGFSTAFDTTNTYWGNIHQAFGNGAFQYCQWFQKTRGATANSHVILQNGDWICVQSFQGSNGGSFQEGASIDVRVDGTPVPGGPGVASMPMAIDFVTNPGTTGSLLRMRIDSQGHVVLGGVVSQTSGQLQNHGTTLATSSIDNARWSNDGSGAWVNLYKSHAAGIGTQGLCLDGDTIATIDFYGSDGAAFKEAAKIMVSVDGAAGLNNMPGRIQFYTTANGGALTERMRIDNAGLVGINTGGPNFILSDTVPRFMVADTVGQFSIGLLKAHGSFGPNIALVRTKAGTVTGHAIVANNDQLGNIFFGGDDGVAYHFNARIQGEVDGTPAVNNIPVRLSFWTGSGVSYSDAPRMIIDSAGHIVLGGAGAKTSGRFQNNGTSFATVSIDNIRWSNDSGGAWINLYKSRGGVGTQTIVANGDQLGGLDFYGSDGTAFQEAAQIVAFVDVAPAGGAVPGRLAFYTTAGAGFVQVERMRIASYGGVGIGSGAQTTGYFHVAAPGVTNSAVAGGNQAGIEVFAYDTGSGGLSVNHYLNLVNYSVDGYGDAMNIKYSRGNAGAAAIVQNGDSLGFIAFWGGAGAGQGFVRAADISSVVDGTPGVNDMPGRLVFRTTPDGSGSLVERARIDSAGVSWLMNGTTKQASVNETAALYNHEALGGI